MKPRRVAVVSLEYPGVSPYHGGIGTQYAAFAPTWASSGVETHVLTSRGRRASPPEVLEGVHIHALAPLSTPWLPLSWSRQMQRLLALHGPFDAVLSPEFRGECSTYSPGQRSGPLVTHLLTSTAQLLSLRPGLTRLQRNGLRTRLYLQLERLQAERSRALFAPGTAIIDWARELWPSLADIHTRVLPLAIRVAQVREQARNGRPPPGFPDRTQAPIVGLASRLDEHKGAPLLLESMQLVWRRHPEARLVFIGRDARINHGMMSDELRRLAGRHAGQIHITGALPPEQYFAAVAACDVIAIPSFWESFCLAAVEAMALGRPVIGTSGHGFDEYMRDAQNGLLVPRGQVEPLANAVERLLGDASLRRRMGAAANETADELDVPRVADRFLDAFADLEHQ